MKILFVCTGNICRSAMAHKMLEKKLKELNKNIEVYSCGVYAQDGDIPTETAIQVMQELAIDLKPHRATNIRNINLDEIDIILCATNSHKYYIANLYPQIREKTYTIKEYAQYNENDWDISDPWGLSLETYRICAKEIEDCLEEIIDKLK